MRGWLAIDPALGDADLRAILYVSRDHLPVITPADELSSVAGDLLEALLAIKSGASGSLTGKLRELPRREVGQIMDRLLGRARQVQAWGTPSILHACLTVAAVDADHGATFARFLRQLPPAQLTAPIVPLLADKPWAAPVLSHWAAQNDTPEPVRKAIAAASRRKG